MQLIVGRIGRPHGIRGEVTVEVRTDEPETRLAPGQVLRTDPESAGPLTVEAAHWHSGRLLLAFAGTEDRSAAEKLRGVLLVIDVPEDARPADPEEFYDHQLIGLAVVTVDEEPVGEVIEILHLPAQDVFAVRRPDGREVLIPFVAEIVPEVDLEDRRLVIDPPPGLVDPETED